MDGTTQTFKILSQSMFDSTTDVTRGKTLYFLSIFIYLCDTHYVTRLLFTISSFPLGSFGMETMASVNTNNTVLGLSRCTTDKNNVGNGVNEDKKRKQKK